MKTAYLVLQNGEIFEAKAFGAIKEAVGEIVFTTAMTGYIETLTDPSYFGQIVVQTFPLIGNYGIIPADFEAMRPALTAYIAKHPCDSPSNFRSQLDLNQFLQRCNIPGLCDIDTRRLTRIIRNFGTLNAKITYSPLTQNDIKQAEDFAISGAVKRVSCTTRTVLGQGIEFDYACVHCVWTLKRRL